MAEKALKKLRSQARAAKKRTNRKSTGRRPAVMTCETFRRISSQTAEAVAKQLDASEDEVMEMMAEEGYLGLDAQGRLATRKTLPSR
ncbi:MAG: hypothetical protein HQL95_02790 [Magnetococcales bacterium]|nr:hypothetical protein [Magnetococcales bacterium]